MILADKIIKLRKQLGWSQEELAEKMNLDINTSVLSIVKIKSIVSIVIAGFGVASLLIVLLSLLGFLQYAQLMLSEASYEIRTLLRIGYSVKSIIYNFIKPLLILFGALTLTAFGLTILIKVLWIQPALENSGIKIESESIAYPLIACIVLFLLYGFANYYNIKKAIRSKGKAG